MAASLIPSFLLICLSAMTMAQVGMAQFPPKVKPRLVRCRDFIRFPKCYNIPFLCPLSCPTTCLLDCAACAPICSCAAPGAICQDPRFVGGDGMTFYFHGQKDKDFCLVSDPNLHINGHFIGKRNPKLTRDYTWVQSIGVMFDNHKLVVAAQRTSTWDDTSDRLALSLDGNPISIPTQEGAKWDSSKSRVVITRTSNTNGVIIEAMDNFKLTVNVVPITAEESRVHNYNITKEDCFAHLELGFKFYNLTDEVDGVLGQTYRSNYVNRAIKPNAPMPVMGGTHKYMTSGLFAADCAVARFGAYSIKKHSSRKLFSLVDMNDKHTPRDYAVSCSSGVHGNGLACK